MKLGSPHRPIALLLLTAGGTACGDDERGTTGGGGDATSSSVGTSSGSSTGPGTSTTTTTTTGGGGGGGAGGTGGEGGAGGGDGGGAPAICMPPALRVAAADAITCGIDDDGGAACRGGGFGASWSPVTLAGGDGPARCVDAVVAQGSIACVHVAGGDDCSTPGFHCIDAVEDGWLPLGGGELEPRWVAVTDDDVCGIDETGDVACAGATTPPDLAAAVPLGGAAGGPRDACAWSAAGIFCWGESPDLQADAPAFPGCVADLDVGPGFACAAYSGLDIVDCWGDLPRGVAPRMFLPAPGVDVAVGDGFVCARTLGGFVRCWGDNADGGLGVPDLAESGIGVQPAWPGELPVATSIAAGRAHVAITTEDGALLAWGDNRDAQICDCDDLVMLPFDTGSSP